MARRLGGALAGATLIGLMTALAAPGAALAAAKPRPFVPGTPKGLSSPATRTKPQTVRVNWKAVAKVDHYDVLVSDGTTQTVYPAEPKATSLDVPTPNVCSNYQVKVGARNATGDGGTTQPITLGSWGPGGVTNLRATRSGDGGSATVTWGLATWAGYHTRGNPKKTHDYRPDPVGPQFKPTTVSVVRDADDTVVYNRVVSDYRPSDTVVFTPDAGWSVNLGVANLSPDAGYTVQVTRTNEFGPCTTQVHLDPASLGAAVPPQVARAADDVHKAQISWQPVAGADHYYLEIVPATAALEVPQGTPAIVRVLPADVTSFTFDVPDPCVSYKIRVGAADAGGAGAYTGYAGLRSLGPSTVMGMTTGREKNGVLGTVTWRPPVWTGQAPLTGYRTELSRYSDSAVLVDQTGMQSDYQFPGLEAGRMYVLKVSAQNEYGTCLTARSVIDRYVPANPTDAAWLRQPQTPSSVLVSWQPPKSGPVPSYYLLTYATGKTTKSVKVGAKATSATLKLDPNQTWTVQLKAYNAVGGSGGVNLAVPPMGTPPQAGTDPVPPTITASANQPTGANGWYRGSATVTFACSASQSRVVACNSPVTVRQDGAGQTVTGTATDEAGTTSTASVVVNVDQTVPTITASVAGAVNAKGWYRTPPVVHFTCADSVSGIASCPADVEVGEGTDQSVTATTTDNAGNTASVSVVGLNVDLHAPTVEVVGATDGSTYAPNALPDVACNTTDATSGVAAPATLATDRGEHATVTVTCAGATDVAGNTAPPTSITYTAKPAASRADTRDDNRR